MFQNRRLGLFARLALTPVNRSFTFGILSWGICLALISQQAYSDLMYPDDIEPGAKYHLVFNSSRTTTATSSDIDTYNRSVQRAADSAGIGESEGVAWYAIASTDSVDARDNAMVGMNVPVYNTNLQLVATGYDDLWDGGLENGISHDEYGRSNGRDSWTGSRLDGTAATGLALGSSSGRAWCGSPNAKNGRWINNLTPSTTTSLSVYALSQEITVPLPQSFSISGNGGSYFEDFDAVLGSDRSVTEQTLPSGWAGSRNGIGLTEHITQAFPAGSSLRNGTLLFNAGKDGDADRALAIGVGRSTESGTLQFLADVTDASADSFQLRFDLETWDAGRVTTLGEAAFDVSIDLNTGAGFERLLDVASVTTGPTLFPPAGEYVDGNAAANRVSFDSGLIDADIPEGSQLRIRWAIPAEALSSGWVFGVDNVALNLFGSDDAAMLQAGDADQDLDFDQLDLVKVQVAGRYLTGQSATWGEGDWNGAPGGQPGNPPAGDGMFNQFDVIAAQQAAAYLTGPYAAIATGGQTGDAQTSVVYNPGTGELAVDAPDGVELTSINVDSAAGIFTGAPADNLGGSFDNDADNNIFKATFGSSFGSLSFGTVAQAGLSEEFVLNDLTVIGSLAGGGDLGNVDLIYVPEPASALLLAIGLVIGLTRIRTGKH